MATQVCHHEHSVHDHSLPAMPSKTAYPTRDPGHSTALAVRRSCAVAVIALLTAVGSVHAQLPDPTQGRSEWDPTDAEVAQLPAYCQAGLRPKQYPGPGIAAYGCGVWINHFCPALTALNRASNPLLPRRARVGALRAAEDHIQYTIKHFQPTCRLASEVRQAEHRAKMLRIMVK
jgi:hypothetical protein